MVNPSAPRAGDAAVEPEPADKPNASKQAAASGSGSGSQQASQQTQGAAKQGNASLASITARGPPRRASKAAAASAPAPEDLPQPPALLRKYAAYLDEELDAIMDITFAAEVFTPGSYPPLIDLPTLQDEDKSKVVNNLSIMKVLLPFKAGFAGGLNRC